MTKSLLIIEDEKLLGMELKRRFAKLGWNVTLVHELAQAQHELTAGKSPPRVVIADMNLPDGNSLDLLDEIRHSMPYTGAWILLTAYGTAADVRRAYRLGAHDFLEKPVSRTRLENAVDRAARTGASGFG